MKNNFSELNKYDYLFTGSGLAALLTIERIIKQKGIDKKILLIDLDPKTQNDRTWCFWDKDEIYTSIQSKEWKSIAFKSNSFSKAEEIDPYKYRMIRSSDFYNFIFNQIKRYKNIYFVNEKVLTIKDTGENVIITTNNNQYLAHKVFNSIPSFSHYELKKYPLLKQHFIGWYIETIEEKFDSNKATFMDFSIPQKGNTRFIYILPISSKIALVEYTLFSKTTLKEKEYESGIIEYLKEQGINNYKIIEKEKGVIPMTSFPFWKNNTKNIIHIGTSGGWTKASTGYTFKKAMKKSNELVQFLKSETDFRKLYKKDKFWFYDLLFVDVLYQQNFLGEKLFSSLFKKSKTQLIFKFLDEETSLLEDLKIILSCPKKPFIKVFFRRIFK